MAKQLTSSRNLKAIAEAALVALGLFILAGCLDAAAAQLSRLLCAVAGEALGALPSVVLAASRVLQSDALDHQRLSPCALQMLVSFSPLLRVMAAVA
jgi:hypothetical protein